MKLSEVRIVADEREKKCGIPGLLASAGIMLETKTLSVGDYIVGPETVVERKTVSDCLSSVFDGRLMDQCDRLAANFKHPVLVLEGSLDGLESMTENPLVFYGAISQAVMRFHMPVIPTPSAAHTAKLLAVMAAKKESAGPLLKKIRKSEDVQVQQLSILSSLPGVGETLAVRLLDRFGTPAAALSAPIPDLAKVAGFGNARAVRVRNVLDRTHKDSNNAQSTLD